MKALVWTVLKKIGWLAVANIVLAFGLTTLRPVFYPNGLPGEFVLIAVLVWIGVMTGILFIVLWPMAQEIENQMSQKMRSRFDNK